MGHIWNLFKWLDAVGVERQDQPDLIHGVQPVVVLGDHSAHASPLLAPVAWMGASVTGVAAEEGTLLLTSSAAGGTFVRQFLVDSAALRYRWHINDSPPTLNNVVANPRVCEMAPTPTVSRARFGTVIGADVPDATGPEIRTTTSATLGLIDPWFIRPGWTLQVSGTTANTTTYMSILFEDALAPPGQS